MHLLGIAAIVYVIYQLIKEACEKPVPAENWANKELYYKDINDGVPMKQVMKNLENGKYKLPETYPEPHRDPATGKVIIENCKLFDEDMEKYGTVQTYKWVDQGKYNLEGEALEVERKRIKEHYDRLFDQQETRYEGQINTEN